MITLESLVGRLGNVPHFKGLTDTALKDIVYAGQILRYKARDFIFSEGEPSAGIYVLFKGQVQLCKLSLHGQETIIALIKPVIMFNEVPAIDGEPNPVSAVAIQDCTTWHVPFDRYQLLLERYPQVGTGLLRVLAARNRLLLSHYENLLSRPVLARAAKMLFDLSNRGQKSINRYQHSNQTMAGLAATVPEAISRSLKTLKELRVIESTRAEIIVHSAEKLANLAQIEPIILESEFQPPNIN